MENETKNILDFLHFHCPTLEQKGALIALEYFVKAENKEDFFILCGAAGTGKTSITSALIGYLNQTEIQYRISAPTGRAARILGKKTKANSSTIHSLIYSIGTNKESGEVKKDKFLIQGFKGSGKTYLYKALKDKKITEIILEKAHVDNKDTYHFIDIIELKGAINNYKQFPFPKEEVKSIVNLQAFWKVYLWASIMLDISEHAIFSSFRKNNPETLLEALLLSLKNSTETERKIIFKKYITNDEDLVIVEKDLKNLNDYLSFNKIRLFVLFDQLDKVANLDDWSLLITPLVEYIRDNYNKPNFTNIFPKIFLRTDIFPRIATNNSLSITTTSTIKIEWEPIEMYAYLFNLVFASDKSQQAFFKL